VRHLEALGALARGHIEGDQECWPFLFTADFNYIENFASA
jgi:hypothetical protein